jgi:hypothetical protein
MPIKVPSKYSHSKEKTWTPTRIKINISAKSLRALRKIDKCFLDIKNNISFVL